jgi:hypothetical protein
MHPRVELESIIRDAWSIYKRTGDAGDAAVARAIEADARALLARLPAPHRKRKQSHKAKKRKALKNCVRLDANAPILPQVRWLGR